MTIKTSQRRNLLSTVAFSVAFILSAQAHADVWQDVSLPKASQQFKSHIVDQQADVKSQTRKLSLNVEELKYTLNQAPSEHFGESNTQIELPLPNGEMRLYTLYHSPIMAKALGDQHTDIQTYRVIDTVNPENSGRLDLTPNGFHGVMSFEGDTVYIDPIGKTGQYKSYFKSEYMAGVSSEKRSAHTCQVHKKKTTQSEFVTSASKTQKPFTFGSNLRTYRLALATTGEFTQFHGGTKDSTLASLVTAVNRINQIYERDLSVRMELVADNSKIIFTDPATDPFSDQEDLGKSLDEVADAIDAQIGLDNYDIGHLLSRGLGGLASFESVCEIDKAEGVSGDEILVTNPEFIELISHEMGHQFGADHTFNGSSGSCDSVTRNASTAWEPGSGSTIMSYAGLCGVENISTSVSPYFHTGSITQMSTYIGDSNKGGQCGVLTSSNNSVPVPNPGQDSHIPQSTPFILMGSATDADAGDVLSYNWEQIDAGTASSGGKAGNVDDGSRAIFRSFPPSSSPNRTFPQISDILTGTSTFGESLPTTDRDLNIQLTVRDGKGGVAAEPVKLTVVKAAGPFVVTAPAAAAWEGNSTQTITWDVANTTAAPISCANVDITLSTDAGQTFATTVITGTPNDGSQAVTVPNVSTTTGRLRVKCASQPFFAVNSAAISITPSGTTTNTAPTAGADSYTVAQDSAVTNFNVLENDADADGDTLTVSAITSVSNGGTVTANGTQVSYQPAAGYNGTETFTYTVSDGNGGTANAQVTVTVTATSTPPANNVPVANNDSFTVDQDSSATNLDVLSNDTDGDGDTLSIAAISNISNGGTATISGTAINYQPAAGFSGTETLSYTISDGTDTSTAATVTISVTATPPPPPPPTPTPAPPASSGGGGGGSFGLFMLILLGAGRKLKMMRLRRFSKKVEG